MDVKAISRVAVAEKIGCRNEIILSNIGQGNELKTGSATQKLLLSGSANKSLADGRMDRWMNGTLALLRIAQSNQK